jgi:hypothetical protein
MWLAIVLVNLYRTASDHNSIAALIEDLGHAGHEAIAFRSLVEAHAHKAGSQISG